MDNNFGKFSPCFVFATNKQTNTHTHLRQVCVMDFCVREWLMIWIGNQYLRLGQSCSLITCLETNRDRHLRTIHSHNTRHLRKTAPLKKHGFTWNLIHNFFSLFNSDGDSIPGNTPFKNTHTQEDKAGFPPLRLKTWTNQRRRKKNVSGMGLWQSHWSH